MLLEFGRGNISVTSYGDEDVAYGVCFKIVPESHEINERDKSVMGKTVDEIAPDLKMEFAKSTSVQVVINKLLCVRDDLRAVEHRVQLTAFGVGIRARISNWLFNLACYISQNGGN